MSVKCLVNAMPYFQETHTTISSPYYKLQSNSLNTVKKAGLWSLTFHTWIQCSVGLLIARITRTLLNTSWRSLGEEWQECCLQVADIHLSPYSGKEVSSASSMSQQGRLKIERMEKELSALTSSAMSYKSLYSKSASQMAAEAMSAAESEAASSKKIRKTVVETSRRQVAAAWTVKKSLWREEITFLIIMIITRYYSHNTTRIKYIYKKNYPKPLKKK